MTTVGGH